MEIVISVILLFVGIGLLALLHVCIIGRGYRRGGGGIMEERVNNGTPSMSKDELKKLPCYDYKGKDSSSSPVDCAVCLENLVTADKCRLLPICKHNFHAQYVDAWFLKTPICPICKIRADSVRDEEDNIGHFGEASIEFRETQTPTSRDPSDEISV